MMKKLTGLALLGLAVMAILCSCDSERYSPIEPTDPHEHTGDTVVVLQLDTVYVMVNDSIVDTVYICADSTNCHTLGKNIHQVMWSMNDMVIMVDSYTPHAYGHEIDICISFTQREGGYDITLTARRDKTNPNQTLNVTMNGKHRVWRLGKQKESTLVF